MFKELFIESYNIDIDGKLNPYRKENKAKLKKLESSFKEQINDLKSKLTNSHLGAGGDKKVYRAEIDEYTLKLKQVQHVLKGK